MAVSIRRGTGATGTNWTTITNAYDAGSATFTQNLNTTVGAQPIDITGYGFDADLDLGGELFLVQATVRQYVSNAARYSGPTIQAYLGTTALSSNIALTESTTSTNVDTVTLDGVTLADIIDPTFKMTFRTNRDATQAATAYLDYVDVTITYTAGRGYWGAIPIA